MKRSRPPQDLPHRREPAAVSAGPAVSGMTAGATAADPAADAALAPLVAGLSDMRAIDLRQLAYFRVLAATRHFGRAAARLGMSQPPLSIQVRQLEQRLGVPLLARDGAGVTLTAAGRLLCDELDGFLPRHAELLARVRAAGRGDVGTLRIGFVTPAEYSFLPDRLREFRLAMPQVSLSLREMTSDAQLAALRDGSLDAGFVLPPVGEPGLGYLPVQRDALVLALPTGHRLADGRGAVDLRAVATEPLVIFPRDKAPGLFDDIMALYAGAGVSPAIGQEAIQMQTIVSLVAAGLGVAVVPGCLRNLGRAGVVYRALRGGAGRVEIGLAWSSLRHDPVCERFRAQVLAAQRVRPRPRSRPQARVASSASIASTRG